MNTAGEAFEKNRLWVAPDFSIKFMRGPMVFFMSGSGTSSSNGADLDIRARFPLTSQCLAKTDYAIFWSGMEQPEICGLSFGPPFMSGLWVAYEWLMRNPCGWQKTSNKYKYLIDVIFKQMIPS